VGGEGCVWYPMKIVLWNLRGLGGFEKRREVRKLVSEKSPFIVCI